ncbi:hypothetical protein ALC60_13146 [Trachymyrmex zeteki]|uniref:RNase H type-1 domain-containing protein n=1 Tax=Mycetomoellerius zeteki TaxID=64791 RepID=A0A151WJ27_9HYME|nr:hypothetical protein ALC60_13146 [Trachymyrmex zeteki]
MVLFICAHTAIVSCDHLGSSITLTKLETCNADSIVNALKKTLEEMKLDLQNLIAIGTDNASVMVGINNGVYAKLKAEVPSLILIRYAGYPRIMIFSDSRSVLETINSDRLVNGNYIIHRIKQLLLQLEGISIESTFFWIPAHKRILGNEVVDKAAKEACVSGPREFFRTPYSDLQAEARSRSQRRFCHYLESKAKDTGAHYSTLYPPESVKP